MSLDYAVSHTRSARETAEGSIIILDEAHHKHPWALALVCQICNPSNSALGAYTEKGGNQQSASVANARSPWNLGTLVIKEKRK